MMPRLLVSVRNSQEALAALAGGADIIDVKEPSGGSLGMADAGTITSVITTVRNGDERAAVSVSAAFGEATEWLPGATTCRRRRKQCSFDRRHCLPLRGQVVAPGDAGRGRIRTGLKRPQLQYAKLGMAGLGRCDWAARWFEVRRKIERTNHPRQWIAVAYADWREADAPRPEAIIEEAARMGCAGVLFDTRTKDCRTLLDWLPPQELGWFCRRARARRLLVALAGRLTVESLPQLAEVSADVIGIRSAVCAGHRRTGQVSAAAVRRFKAALISPPRLRGAPSGPGENS